MIKKKRKKIKMLRALSRSLQPGQGQLSLVNSRLMSSSKSTSTQETAVDQNEIKKSVFISQSNDVYTNLALEDWLYRNFDFTRHHVLLLWVNNPAVVVGRFQNPFTETNVARLMESGIALARRNSGGGAVYHDLGNLNCTFFTARERYDRKYNLNILTRALFREWAVDAEINKRDDIVIKGKKISGTAAKLGRPNSYHHCTLLANADKSQLGQFLASDEVKYISKATASVRSPIKNLCDINRSINTSRLISAIGYEYLRTSATELTDGGAEQAMKQKGFQLVNPTDKWFPGIEELREGLTNWDWIIGKTPNFSVEKELTLKDANNQHKIKLSVDVEKGLIADRKSVV